MARKTDVSERSEKSIKLKKPELRVPAKLKKLPKPAELAALVKQPKHFGRRKQQAAPAPDGTGSFAANIRPEEPMLRAQDVTAAAAWKRDLPVNMAGGLLLVSFFSMFFMMIDEPSLAACSAAAFVVYTALTTLESFTGPKIRYIVSGAAFMILIAAAAIWHGSIGGGAAMTINSFYDVAEEAQAYLYDRLPGGDDASLADARWATVWFSALAGLLASLPGPKVRRAGGIILTAAVMLALAYYGLVPSWICAGAMVLALLLTLSRDNMLAAVPLLLAVALIFGALVLIDPGENYGISRMDENIRDRIAFHSALIETEEQQTPGNEFYDETDEYYDDESDYMVEDSDASWLGWGLLILILAAAGAAAYLLAKRFKKRRDAVRKGIDSKDPREAVTAMFPYSVRWLAASGVESRNEPFASMGPAVKENFSAGYAVRFREMYALWRRAAYSDHDITENERSAMDAFMKDTIKLVEGRWKPAQKLRMLLRYAL